ncbi:MAG: hypothetical protein VKJ46_12285 [Leptolyngbyaceae bacterium]|nr:hypothetical protein [Leptolyngbyaceae bacterium]
MDPSTDSEQACCGLGYLQGRIIRQRSQLLREQARPDATPFPEGANGMV